MFAYRSYSTFKVCAIIVGLIVLIGAVLGIYEGITGGMDTDGLLVNLFMAILGIALIAGGMYIHIVLSNKNAGKTDESIRVSYDITYQGRTQTLEDLSALIENMRTLAPSEEILVRLVPEYFGLVDWKFIKIKNQYLSFVQIRKKDKLVQYFVMPCTNVEDAIKPFAEVFEKHMAVNTSILIEMKRYQAVLDCYKLK